MPARFNIAQEDKTLTFDGAGDHILSGVVQDNLFGGPNGGPLVKNGSGTLRVQNTVQMSGTTTVNAGAYLVNGFQGLGPISVLGGIFGGTGGVGEVTAMGGQFNPGDNGPGILSAFDDVTFTAAATFAVELNGTTAGAGGYDQ